jgi:hypothetical protein
LSKRETTRRSTAPPPSCADAQRDDPPRALGAPLPAAAYGAVLRRRYESSTFRPPRVALNLATVVE